MPCIAKLSLKVYLTLQISLKCDFYRILLKTGLHDTELLVKYAFFFKYHLAFFFHFLLSKVENNKSGKKQNNAFNLTGKHSESCFRLNNQYFL